MNKLAVTQLLEGVANELLGIDADDLTTAEKNIVRRLYNFRKEEKLPEREELTRLYNEVSKGPR
jgi:predicted nucleotidyltransferase